MQAAQVVDISTEARRLDDLGPGLRGLALGAGVIGLGLAVVMTLIASSWQQFLASYLVNFCYFLSLALGALFFVLIQHATRAGWSVVVRRVAEAVMMTLPLLALLSIPILAGLGKLYPWVNPDPANEEFAHLMHKKEPYLNLPFFLVRVALYFVIWGGFAAFFYRRSVQQDASGDPRLTSRMQSVSYPALVLYAFTVTFAAFDFLKSLSPQFFSTIFGVYYFSGSVVSSCSLLAVLFYLLQKRGKLTRVVTTEHFHDLGKLMFAFTVFWAYIAFSQYMLIWYANIPEETFWYLNRQTGGWTRVSLALLFGHFVVPFLLLISRIPKRNKWPLFWVGIWILIIHWVDIFWLARPQGGVAGAQVPLHLLDGLCFLGLGGFFVAAIVHHLTRHSLLPERDPYLPESLKFENF